MVCLAVIASIEAMALLSGKENAGAEDIENAGAVAAIVMVEANIVPLNEEGGAVGTTGAEITLFAAVETKLEVGLNMLKLVGISSMAPTVKVVGVNISVFTSVFSCTGSAFSNDILIVNTFINSSKLGN